MAGLLLAVVGTHINRPNSKKKKKIWRECLRKGKVALPEKETAGRVSLLLHKWAGGHHSEQMVPMALEGLPGRAEHGASKAMGFSQF